MAKAAEVSKAQAASIPMTIPAGFTDETRANIDGWFSAPGNEGVVIYGRIVGSLQFPDKKDHNRMRDAVLIKVYGDTPAMNQQEPVMLKQGQVLALGISHSNQVLMSYVEHKGIAWLQCGKSKPIGGGQSVREWTVACKGQKSAPPSAAQAEAATPPPGFATEADDVPF